MGLWSTIKSGVKKFGKFAYEHHEGIGKAIGAGLDVASTLGVPGAGIASQVVKGIANVSKAVGDDKFSNGIKSTMKKKDKGTINDSDFESLKAKYKQMKADRTTNDTNSSSNNTQPTTSAGYSLNVKGSGGTRHSRIYSWVR